MAARATHLHEFGSFLSSTRGFLLILALVSAAFGIVELVGVTDRILAWLSVVLSAFTLVISAIVLISQSRDTSAIHAKLDEIILASTAENESVGIEKLSEEEILTLKEKLEARK